MEHKTILSIVIPVYNGEQYIKESVESVIKSCSNLKMYEIVISDNYSTDKTASILASIDNDQIRIVSPPSRCSIGENWTFVTEQAKGDYIKLLGADDLQITPLEKEIELLQARPQTSQTVDESIIILELYFKIQIDVFKTSVKKYYGYIKHISKTAKKQ